MTVLDIIAITSIAIGFFGFYHLIRKINATFETEATDMDRESDRSLWTTKNWRDASYAYFKWLEENPMEGPAHPEAQRLHRIRTGAYMLFLDAHPHVPDDGFLAHLVDLMEDYSF